MTGLRTPQPEWLRALRRQQTCVLVSVIQTQGSAPRIAGARMVVSREQSCDTIGGGHLEWQATQVARELLHAVDTHLLACDSPDLATACQVRLQRYALGASLGQCCGGVVWLLFEPLPAGHTHRFLQAMPNQRLDSHLQDIQHISPTQLHARLVTSFHEQSSDAQSNAAQASGHIDWQQERLIEYPLRYSQTLAIFGGGHVTQALLPMLLPLDWHCIVVDSREEVSAWFARQSAAWSQANAAIELRDSPLDEVKTLPPNTLLVIMTHDHQLDFAVLLAALARDDWRYLGLIGSHSKYASFMHRLRARGVTPARQALLTSPIGVAHISGKTPQEVAIAIAAELLQVASGIPASTLPGKWRQADAS